MQIFRELCSIFPSPVVVSKNMSNEQNLCVYHKLELDYMSRVGSVC